MSNNIVKITEADLKELIKESVRNVLQEVSLDTALSAKDKALQLGRLGQANTFNKYAVDKINDGENRAIRDVSTRDIVFANIYGKDVRLDVDGSVTVEGKTGNLERYPNAPVQIKASNKAAARQIAKWCSKYMVELDNEEVKARVSDWHWWACL